MRVISMVRSWRRVGAACRAAGLGLTLLAAAGPALAAELSVAAPLAVQEALVEVATRFEQASGHRVRWVWGGSEAVARRVSDGEVVDVVVNTRPGLERLATAGQVVTPSVAMFARSGIGVGSRPGWAAPDLSSVDGLKAALLAASTVAISSGASGRYLEGLFQRLGVADVVRPKLTQPPSGAQIGQMLARGEVDLGFQQVTELVHAQGFVYLGPLPAAVQHDTPWAAGLHSAAPEPDAGQAFIRALKDPAAAAAMRRAGMVPM